MVRLKLLPRSTAWRASRAGILTAAGILAAPVVFLLPPHAVWGMGSVITGLVLGGRKWAERYTLLELETQCPRCGHAVAVKGPTRFRNGSNLSCDGCHHSASLQVPESALAS